MTTDDTVFALLDDPQPGAASRLYTGFLHTHRCSDPALLGPWAQAVQRDLAAGRHAVLLAEYEAGEALAGLGAGGGSIQVLVFDRLQRLPADDADAWLAAQDGTDTPGPVATLDLAPTITRERFDDDIARIHAAIADGETYQVNHTYRWQGRLAGSPWALYRRLRAHQPVAYGALIRLPPAALSRDDGESATQWVLSRSPELFVRHERGALLTQPMKGTLPRHGDAATDAANAQALRDDAKNRAENLMIVDLLRNDLGRIAQPGSVQVAALFDVQPLATVLQMTSTVRATRRPEVGLAELLAALFPCGSITGAPKRRTMQWIRQLETTPRGLYCGAIGWLDAPAGEDDTCPDLCLNVAIRTLTLGPAGHDGTRTLTMGTGGGIVADSDPAQEWAETQWKARFLTTLDPGFELFETMWADEGSGLARIALLPHHRARLAASAQALGFHFHADAFDALLATLPPGLLRVRVALARDGRLALTHAPLLALPAGPVGLRLATAPLPATRFLPTHKTTARAAYDAGVRAAEAEGAFDTLFVDEAGRLLEGGRSSVFLKLDGRWVTPPVSDGVLPGVMRAALLADPAWAASERTLSLADLARAEAIVLTNALRGALPATLQPPR